jgi:hypothetical protein
MSSILPSIGDRLDLSRLPGILTSRQGGTGISVVPRDHVVLGTGEDTMRAVSLEDFSRMIRGRVEGKVSASNIVGTITLDKLPRAPDSRYFLGATAGGIPIWRLPAEMEGVQSSRRIDSGRGLEGGGNLTQNRTLRIADFIPGSIEVENRLTSGEFRLPQEESGEPEAGDVYFDENTEEVFVFIP